MLFGTFTEMPYQPKDMAEFHRRGGEDLGISNAAYDPELGGDLYHRYFDEKQYAEEVGFDAFMLNEHHTLPGCMQGVTNVGASILARITQKAKIVILGNMIPVWDDPMWMAEQLAMIDVISRGRLVSGWVRGGGRESVVHNAAPVYNRERFEEAHDFIIKAWTTPGPFRYEGKHYNYRYVNPWPVPLQKPHPQIWIPNTTSLETIEWAARHRLPMVMTAHNMEPSKKSFELYAGIAAEEGYEAGPQHRGYLIKVHAEETEELADQVGRKYLQGPQNPFVSGNQARQNAAVQRLPGLVSRSSRAREAKLWGPGGYGGNAAHTYEEQSKEYLIISGTPKTVVQRVRHVMEVLRPGSFFFWDSDGSMTHQDAMRSIRLMGQEVLPALRDIGKELGLVDSFETNDGTGYDQAVWRKARAGTPA
ncbi:MAG: LLM class flavin-dependent oxidoreductase [Dehalococcoidia bacterium]|nr:LLM class flavin-dependent oxidoreductase [Dehalococcoidia bacterium]